jgi:hypothetical protein
MTSRGWRTLCLALGAVCLGQQWRDCHREPDAVTLADCPTAAHPGRTLADDDRPAPAHDEPAPAAEPAIDDGVPLFGITVPPWLAWFAPHPGEDLRSYRDRMLPLAQAAIAPQRARVARSRDDLAQRIQLDAHQRAELDGATQDAAAALEERVAAAVLNGEVSPSTFKPMTGVAIARDLLDIVSRGNRRFVDSLREDQRTKLADHPFDFGDYLVFSTPWENALKLLD